MKAPLVPIAIASPYPANSDQKVNLPEKNAQCTPDTRDGILAIDAELQSLGGKLVISDMFRSYDMQSQSHMDYVNHKKTAFSPPPGGSLHEAGRAFDMDLSKIKVPLEQFWQIAARHGFLPIIDSPNANMNEAWHFDCGGSHRLIYDYYKAGKGTNFPAYTAMAASAINAVGIRVDAFGERQQEAFIQGALIRLGCDIGNIDGDIGPKTKAALSTIGVRLDAVGNMVADIETLIQQKFPAEYQ